MKKLKNMLIAGLILVVLCQLALNIQLKKEKVEAYETACALSDIVRIHLDSPYCTECGFDECFEDYVGNLDCYNYTIDTLNLEKYTWCY